MALKRRSAHLYHLLLLLLVVVVMVLVPRCCKELEVGRVQQWCKVIVGALYFLADNHSLVAPVVVRWHL